MALKAKMIERTEIKTSGDVFHELFGNKPHHVSTISPSKVQACDLHDGEFGTVGSIICWNYYHDGKARIAKQRIAALDEENKLVVFQTLEGNFMELYKTFVVTLHVETRGENDLVTWTIDYEKLNPDVEEPTETMDFLIALVRDIEAHHLK